MSPAKVKDIPDAGYDWFAPSGQGEAVLTPELSRLAGEILERYSQFGNEKVDVPRHTVARRGYFRRILRSLGGRDDEPVCVVLPMPKARTGAGRH
jgi:hypothetical protein